MPPASPHAATAPPYRVIDRILARVVDPTESVPDSVGEVEIYVPPYAVGSRVADVLPHMTSLRYVQTLTAGVDNIRGAIPEGVTLCSGRGIHDTSTAELVLTLVLASLRGVPSFVRAQDRHEWTPGWHQALADKTVLLVGYGAIGAAVEARLAPFECSVVRVARSARDGVHPISHLPALLAVLGPRVEKWRVRRLRPATGEGVWH